MNVILYLANLLCAIAPAREIVGLRRLLITLGGVKIGKNTRIANRVVFHGRYTEVGDNVWIGPGVELYSTHRARIKIGSRVDIAPRCKIQSGTHWLGGSERRAGEGRGIDVVIGDGAWIGMGALILPGSNIGRGSMVAAGSVVVAGTYPVDVLLAGVPARVKRELTSLGQLPDVGV